MLFRSLVTLGEMHCIFRLSEQFTSGYVPTESPAPINMPSQVLPSEAVCGWLVMSKGLMVGQDFRLVNGECRLGSASGLELTIPDANVPKHALTFFVSPKECRISWVADQIKLSVNAAEVGVNALLGESDHVQIDQLEGYIKWLRS